MAFAVLFTNILAPYGRIYLELVAVDLPSILFTLRSIKIKTGNCFPVLFVLVIF